MAVFCLWRPAENGQEQTVKPVGNNRFYGANDPRRNTGLSLGY
jgi:hypothetical protein